MKRGRKWLQKVMPLLVLVCLGLAQNSFAQDDYGDNDNSTYDNNDEALIQPEEDVNYNTFHDELSPYGSWRDYPGYGNVWVCNVSGFRPYYSGGHWAYTRFGWTWVSDYNWGWAPFHYGRWSFDNAYGWFWVPGYTWGPAWVSWRNGGDYYGWAPLSPGLNVSVNVGIGIPSANWVFLPHHYMGYRGINSYYVPRQQNVTIIRNTTIINNTNVYNNNRYVVGPNRRDVERYSGQRIQQQNIYVSNQRTGGRQDRNGIHMYSPSANRAAAANNGSRQDQRDNRIPNRQNNTTQDNVRQPIGRQPSQNGIQQQNNVSNGTNRIPDRSQERSAQRQDNFQNNNGLQNDQQRQQRMMENRRQQTEQQQDNQRQQQVNAQRQQQTEQQQQQMNSRRQEMQQQMEQRRQQQNDNQQRQQMQQQRQQQQDAQRQQQQQQRQQMQQQRQQQMQQRQQQPQQRSQDFNRPAQQGGGRRKGS